MNEPDDQGGEIDARGQTGLQRCPPLRKIEARPTDGQHRPTRHDQGNPDDRGYRRHTTPVVLRLRLAVFLPADRTAGQMARHAVRRNAGRTGRPVPPLGHAQQLRRARQAHLHVPARAVSRGSNSASRSGCRPPIRSTRRNRCASRWRQRPIFACVRDIFRFIWRDGRDPSTTQGFLALCKHIGLPDGPALIESEETKAQAASQYRRRHRARGLRRYRPSGSTSSCSGAKTRCRWCFTAHAPQTGSIRRK